MTNFELVAEFHRATKQKVRRKPTTLKGKEREFRASLIDEEVEELIEAMYATDVADIAKELADLLYVVYGAGHYYGIDLDAVFAEVHRYNMAKTNSDRCEDKEILKLEDWNLPNIEAILWPS